MSKRKNTQMKTTLTVLTFLLATGLAAGRAAGATLARDVAFLTAHAPTRDLPLPGDFVTNNCLLAAQARATAIESYPDEIYLDYVLPPTTPP